MNTLLLEARNLRANKARPAENFSEGLVRLKRRTSLTWDEMTWALGVDTRQLLRWRRGAMPSGAAMLALVRLAAQAPDGIFDLLGDDFIILLTEQHQSGTGENDPGDPASGIEASSHWCAYRSPTRSRPSAVRQIEAKGPQRLMSAPHETNKDKWT